ncbi:MAG: DUF1572 domain-containing protein [Bacteroidia bacterium]|nr:DUF1572 domain-containing protein [Bacteroidia bacterium]
MENTLIESLKTLFNRDLKKLKKEIEAYQDEQHLWITEKNISNCAGNLCLHLIGNLNAFIGAELGNSGYVRKRDLEFSQKRVSRLEMLLMIDDTKSVVEKSLNQLTAEDLLKDFPLQVFNEKVSTLHFLLHLSTHFNYHLGQINYHRRLLD